MSRVRRGGSAALERAGVGVAPGEVALVAPRRVGARRRRSPGCRAAGRRWTSGRRCRRSGRSAAAGATRSPGPPSAPHPADRSRPRCRRRSRTRRRRSRAPSAPRGCGRPSELSSVAPAAAVGERDRRPPSAARCWPATVTAFSVRLGARAHEQAAARPLSERVLGDGRVDARRAIDAPSSAIPPPPPASVRVARRRSTGAADTANRARRIPPTRARVVDHLAAAEAERAVRPRAIPPPLPAIRAAQQRSPRPWRSSASSVGAGDRGAHERDIARRRARRRPIAAAVDDLRQRQLDAALAALDEPAERAADQRRLLEARPTPSSDSDSPRPSL